MNNLDIFEFDTIPSTNDFLLQIPSNGKTQLCIAKKQTKGRGQYQRIWQTQEHSALFSLKITLNKTQNISGISLVVALAIVEVLQDDYQLNNLQIKWPNDILLGGKKLGGILIENQIKNNQQFLIMGVGINILSDGFASINKNINTKQLIMRISSKIIDFIEIFKENNFAYFTQNWQKYDFLAKQKTPIIYENNQGFSLGVDDNGSLIFTDTSKQTIIHSSNKIQIKL